MKRERKLVWTVTTLRSTPPNSPSTASCFSFSSSTFSSVFSSAVSASSASLLLFWRFVDRLRGDGNASAACSARLASLARDVEMSSSRNLANSVASCVRFA